MDEFSPYGYEDVEFCIRAVRAGKRNYVDPQILMLHGTDRRHLERQTRGGHDRHPPELHALQGAACMASRRAVVASHRGTLDPSSLRSSPARSVDIGRRSSTCVRTSPAASMRSGRSATPMPRSVSDDERLRSASSRRFEPSSSRTTTDPRCAPSKTVTGASGASSSATVRPSARPISPHLPTRSRSG